MGMASAAFFPVEIFSTIEPNCLLPVCIPIAEQSLTACGLWWTPHSEAGVSRGGINVCEKGLACEPREGVAYVSSILGNRGRSLGHGGDLVRLHRDIVLQREGVAPGTEEDTR